MSTQRQRNPAGGPGFGGAYKNALGQLYGTAQPSRRPNAGVYLPRDWRNRLPAPLDYYRAHLEGFTGPNAAGNAAARCPFHDDKHASLSVNVTGRGLWRCHACGAGGDLVGFHMRRAGLDFPHAVRGLLGLAP